MNTNDPDNDTATDPGRETPPRTVMVELPGECPEGHEWVAAFRQPLPLKAMAKLCKVLPEAYGKEARVHPQGDWIAVSGVLAHDRAPEAPTPTWRVCEVMPTDADDGGTFTAANAEAAATMMARRHPNVMEYDQLYVWPDGEAPGPDNLLAVATKAIAFADAVVNPTPADA